MRGADPDDRDMNAVALACIPSANHLTAQRPGRERRYRRYELRVARVERAYTFVKEG
jgi:hypothetical protein